MELRTERLRLREFAAEDAPALLAYQSDPLYQRFYPWVDRTLGDVRAFIQLQLDRQIEVPRIKYQLVITLRGGDGTAIGNCGLRMDHPHATEADLGYELAPWHWGRGYATEAAAALVDFGFNALGLHRIWAECIAENTASSHVMEKLGMQREGRFRDKVWMKGRWWDTLIYAILEDVWQDRP